VARDESSTDAPAPVLEGAGRRVGVLCARFNSRITLRLLDGVQRGLAAAGVRPDDVTVEWVPGSFELPLAAKTLIETTDVDAVVCLGAVIRGETTHYDLVSGECARGLQDVQLATGVPVIFGVLTTEDVAQAEARSEGPGGHNVGEEAAAAAVEMAALVARWKKC
jgi:6,7-dimethyl-8-ribityllumazine synthase